MRCLVAAHKGAGPPPTNCDDDRPNSIRPTTCPPMKAWLHRQCRLTTTGRPAPRRQRTRPKRLGRGATTTAGR